jgi:hypothetical protein
MTTAGHSVAHDDIDPGARRSYWESSHEALAVTIALLRVCPWLETSWRSGKHDHAVCRWLEHHAVSRAVDEVRARRQDKFLGGLLDAAQRRLEDEQEQLGTAWGYVTGTSAWPALPQAARELYGALHAKARHGGRFGGPEQLVSHRLACDVIDALYGTRYKPGSISYASKHLLAVGFVAITPGRPYPSGGRRPQSVRATVYGLLPGSLLRCIASLDKALPRPQRLCQKRIIAEACPSCPPCPEAGEDGRPRLPDEVIERMIDARQRWPWDDEKPEPQSGLSPEWNAALIAMLEVDDIPLAVPGRHGRAARSFDEIMADAEGV